ncbi:MAG TPA: RluA family pseudouridine synthase [Candidatus Limnocylindrales bacterium]|nr:RluA family pseudouridine synthase [Candidatus Limnocylindrales bacterium]
MPPTAAIRHVVPPGIESVRLVDYLKACLVAVPVTEIGDLITGGFVAIDSRDGGSAFRGRDTDNRGQVGRTIDRLNGGDRISIDAAELARLESTSRWNPPWDHPVAILHEDDDVLVVAKPAGMHVHPLADRRERTLINALVFHAGVRPGHPWGNWRPHVVQRLDRVVAGLLVVARSAEAKAALVREQKRGELSRTYVAMVSGVVERDAGIIDAAIGRDPLVRGRRCVQADGMQRAITHWKVIARREDRTLVELRPETGRTHQLRVHLASIGHPILFDDLYQPADSSPDASCGQSASREIAQNHARAIALHASEVRFRHPRSGDFLCFRLDPPEDFGVVAAPSLSPAAP